ncbi:glycerophosphoryl diester phosphodiesterase [Salmonirosea aquatica]|uniref:Glycerophosphoryl diester phosphodiesterase n=1 Tax=Salmonirosea aquatica TaxID=2654236 RepID=A0A7C9BGI7_9BACT|nr:glycerophosphoryl diester phosphodiesterase [Cytophagaceae bacterium SJW1-29]
MINRRFFFLTFLLAAGFVTLVQGQKSVQLANDHLRIQWHNTSRGWQIQKVAIRKNNKWDTQLTPSGEYTLIYSETKPSDQAAQTFEKSTGGTFPEENYHYQQKQWQESTTAVALNTAGKAYHFFPTTEKMVDKNHLQFTSETEVATLTTDWKLDEKYPTDVVITQTLTPKKQGYFSLASPSLATISVAKMGWTSVPGYFQGNYMQDNFAKAYAYGFGIPKLPVVYCERTASTLAPLVSTKSGVTLAVIPEPGLGRDPWAKDKITQTEWRIGLSHMNRKGQLSPTLYYPVLGEYASERGTGESLTYSFRYSLVDGDWFKTLNHAIYDIYQFKEGLALRQSTQSLTDRIEQMHHYLTDPKTSMWNIEDFEGLKIGAQSYLGGVVGSNRDAMKNSDYGAMWMLGKATHDPDLTENVLPYALNFKLTQQQTEPGFFQGAAIGQYYLAKKKKFVEEWGEVVEPMAVTYYIMLDVGNMLLFEPNNQQLKDRLRLGAENLLRWQKPDGSWSVAYDHKSQQELFEDVADYRPTFYGLLVAYRILKDPKYLEAAKKGADWFVKNGVNRGSFLGVCGDARYAPDFATGQSAQALLDLYDLTKKESYKEAAIKAAKIYTSSIYTHPIPDHSPKMVNGTPREDWEISQAGLSFEHGGIFGSANRGGPIQLASHAGMFIRMNELTGEPLFADMARAAAVGRDAFVDPKTSVASYYWQAMNKGAGPYPHHAWWQIGWITDYLLSEAELRSHGKVSFPRGFVTPKVGPHQTYGFAPGTVNGEKANLVISEDWVKVDQPVIDYILAESVDSKKKFVILLNDRAQATDFTMTLAGKSPTRKQLPPWGIEVVSFE